ncbi:hypothetical protein JCM10914A_48060 [Paenibacillus sp. JCM 10914]|uniref:M56 family metallopeptidase n=1 Tax=Paenibacillus sp. JCM 10914 TaxID=1236974 RepID=UPI0003CC5463|nr:M56 family metallopeptidase [Paenibacillus sp. JCM 10914]GAE06514.1 regulatory sensor-transducer, BlaR1/MecR1 family [Paenibacillus sp. JCM 10914]
MNNILENLFSLTVAGSVVTISILLLRLVPTDIFPTKWRYRLCILAVVFYLVPITLGIPWFSLLSTSHTTSLHHTQPVYSSGFILETFMPEITISANVAYILLSLWAIGAIGFAVWQLYCYRRFLNELEHTRTIVPKNSEAATQLHVNKEKLGLRSNVKLAYSPIIRSPILVGLWKPTIYLPLENYANIDMGMVIHHELTHLKRKDLWIKAFTLGVSALHWFNPLVHTVRKEVHTWGELSCDEDVVKEMSHAERKRYGETILNVMAGSRNLPVQFCASLSGDGKQLKRRLTIMLNVKKMKRKTLFLSITAVLLIAGISTSAAAWASNATPQIVANTETNPSERVSAVAEEGPTHSPVLEPEVVAPSEKGPTHSPVLEPEVVAPSEKGPAQSPVLEPEVVAPSEKGVVNAEEGQILSQITEPQAVPSERVSVVDGERPVLRPITEPEVVPATVNE